MFYAQWLLCCIWTYNHNAMAVYVLCNKLIITFLPFISILNALEIKTKYIKKTKYVNLSRRSGLLST